MKRVSVQELKPGISLSEPIYTEDRKLLLAKGLPFTREMQIALRDSAWKYVFIGEWNDADAARYNRATPLTAYRAEAERMADTLLRSFHSDLSAVETSARPMGPPLHDAVDRQLVQQRTPEVRDEFHAKRRETSALVERICEGIVPPEQVAEAASGVVESIIAQFGADPSLAANLVNLKGAGEYLYTHSLNRAVLTLHIAAGLGYSRKQVSDIAVSALVADFGMTMVPRNVVNVPRRLTAPEFAEIQRHALYSLHAIRKMAGLPVEAALVAYQMHERHDGSGYPGHRKAGQIHRYAAIAAVADVFDAMTSPRPWRAALPPYRAMETLVKESAEGKYDREAVRALLEYVSLFPIGSLVRLNNGEIAKVVHATGKTYNRPVVTLIFDRHGHRHEESTVIDLTETQNLRIDSFVEGKMGVSVDEGF